MWVRLIIEKPNNLITQKIHYGAVLPPSQMVFFYLIEIQALEKTSFSGCHSLSPVFVLCQNFSREFSFFRSHLVGFLLTNTAKTQTWMSFFRRAWGDRIHTDCKRFESQPTPNPLNISSVLGPLPTGRWCEENPCASPDHFQEKSKSHTDHSLDPVPRS